MNAGNANGNGNGYGNKVNSNEQRMEIKDDPFAEWQEKQRATLTYFFEQWNSLPNMHVGRKCREKMLNVKQICLTFCLE